MVESISPDVALTGPKTPNHRKPPRQQAAGVEGPLPVFTFTPGAAEEQKRRNAQMRGLPDYVVPTKAKTLLATKRDNEKGTEIFCTELCMMSLSDYSEPGFIQF